MTDVAAAPTPTPEQQDFVEQNKQKFAEAGLKLYFSLPWWKQTLILLLIGAFCAICFQLVHGFDVLCDVTTKTGMKVCIGTEPHHDTAFAAHRQRLENWQESMSEDMASVAATVRDIKRSDSILVAKAEITDRHVNWLASCFQNLPGAPAAIRKHRLDSAAQFNVSHPFGIGFIQLHPIAGVTQ